MVSSPALTLCRLLPLFATSRHLPCSRASIRVDQLTVQVAQLHEAQATEARCLLAAFGCRPIIMDRREARLARTEQRLSMAFGAAHSRAYQAGVSLRHLVSLLAGGKRLPRLGKMTQGTAQ